MQVEKKPRVLLALSQVWLTVRGCWRCSELTGFLGEVAELACIAGLPFALC